MRAPTPPSAETDAAVEVAITFLRSCAANNWFDAAPAGISFFRPKHKRAKLDAMYEKNFTKLFGMARKGDVEVDHYLRQELSEETDLSPAKREARRWLLLSSRPTSGTAAVVEKKVANQDRDFIIAQAVLHATAATGLPATRGTRPPPTAAYRAPAWWQRRCGGWRLPRMTRANHQPDMASHHAKREPAKSDMKTIAHPAEGPSRNNQIAI